MPGSERGQEPGVQATDANDDTVQTTFGQLRTNTAYHYRFCFLDGARAARSAGS